MSVEELVRQWKQDEGIDNPAGPIEITDDELLEVQGGSPRTTCTCTACPTSRARCGHH